LAHSVHLHGPAMAVLDDTSRVLATVSGLGVLGMPAAVRRDRRQRSGIDRVDSMSGEEFESRLAHLFHALGEDVRHTGRRGDFGADLVTARGEVLTVVQAKRYDGAVGIEAVQQVIGARRYYDADEARVVTNSVLTPAALALAQADGVQVVERGDLASLLAAHPEARRLPTPWFLCLQVASGALLVGYAAIAVCRLARLLLRAAARAARRLVGV
ncbi:MAG: restriction endonuclease, partial [Acidimicrobiales bacterium]